MSTYTLKSGDVVTARTPEWPTQYSNRTQAENAARKIPGATVIQRGRPFYVRVGPLEDFVCPDGPACPDTDCREIRHAQGLDDWGIAYAAGRRVFFEQATDTIRQCPENYCLLVRRDSRWVTDIDAASTINAHSLGLVMDQGWRTEFDGAVLADAIEEAFYGSQPLV